MSFSETLRSIRKSLNLSQQAFAKELGVSFATINRWEGGLQRPSPLALQALISYCQMKGIAATTVKNLKQQ